MVTKVTICICVCVCKKIYIQLYTITESLCSTPEINTTF